MVKKIVTELSRMELIAEGPMSLKARRLHRELMAEVESDLLNLVAA